jgi:hypothetical protein
VIRQLLLKDVVSLRDYEMSEPDQPVLLLQLILKLLARTLPRGPQAMATQSTIDIDDQKSRRFSTLNSEYPKKYRATWARYLSTL